MARQNFANVDEYLQIFPQETREILEKIRKIIQKIMPEATELISYQIPAYKLNGKYVIYFSGFKNHISLFPRSSAMEKFFGPELDPYSSGRGTIQFQLKNPIPYDFIKKIVEFRLKETQAEKK